MNKFAEALNCEKTGICDRCERMRKQKRAATPTMITTEQAAELIGVAPSRVRQLAAEGSLRGEKFGAVWMFDAAAVKQFASTRVDKRRRQAVP